MKAVYDPILQVTLGYFIRKNYVIAKKVFMLLNDSFKVQNCSRNDIL